MNRSLKNSSKIGETRKIFTCSDPEKMAKSLISKKK